MRRELSALNYQLFARIKVGLISNNGAREMIIQVKGLIKPGRNLAQS
jgi:hypothetical protein